MASEDVRPLQSGVTGRPGESKDFMTTPAELDRPPTPARIRFDANGRPYSDTFDDIYYNDDGPQEVQRVFIAPSKLTARFMRSEHFTLGELGFGSGLNFVVAADEWLRHGTGVLHFISVERHPLRRGDLTRCAQAHRDPRYASLYAELIAAYPPLVPGWHRRWLAEGRIMLSLFWGDALAGWRDIGERQTRGVDAWFLDGFAPARNPRMWDPALYTEIAGLTAPGGSVATFTAAGAVRRQLAAAGFDMQRIDQRPHKRESLAGRFTGRGRCVPRLPRQVTIVGAGIAGASVAQHLSRFGVQTRVLDGGAGAGTSHTLPAALVHTRLMANTGPAGRLRRNAFGYAQHLVAAHPAFRRCGILQTATTPQASERLRQVWRAQHGDAGDLDWRDAAHSGHAAGGLFFPTVGRLDPGAYVDDLLRHPNIERTQVPLTPRTLERIGAGPVVLANGLAARQFPLAAHLEIAPIGGQIDLAVVPDAAAHALAGAHYQIPAPEAGTNALWLGTSYEHAPWAPARATAHNLAQLHGRPHRWLRRYRGYRCVSSDRWPVIGALEVSGEQRLWISAGHGSMGMVSGPLGGAAIASELCGTFAPLTTPEAALVSPDRFIARQLRRGYRMGARERG